MTRRRGQGRDLLLAIFLVSALAALIWPIYPLVGSSIEPRVLGLPFSLAWVVIWLVLSFLAMWIYHVSGSDERG
ncbi:MAG TPA: hypothetical protein VD788_03825 [Candidatus Polarisedimenticolaceae bacterium]|nr:hypothetical protein [Candidatus Polarisedimenticolaceae bacterium]